MPTLVKLATLAICGAMGHLGMLAHLLLGDQESDKYGHIVLILVMRGDTNGHIVTTIENLSKWSGISMYWHDQCHIN
jgi:hypothetical protein